MDMSQYSGAAFLKIGDVKVNGPLRVVIDDIQLGKYGKPDVSFTDGTNCRSTQLTTGLCAMRMGRKATAGSARRSNCRSAKSNSKASRRKAS